MQLPYVSPKKTSKYYVKSNFDITSKTLKPTIDSTKIRNIHTSSNSRLKTRETQDKSNFSNLFSYNFSFELKKG